MGIHGRFGSRSKSPRKAPPRGSTGDLSFKMLVALFGGLALDRTTAPLNRCRHRHRQWCWRRHVCCSGAGVQIAGRSGLDCPVAVLPGHVGLRR
jgi:hypothetical protein